MPESTMPDPSTVVGPLLSVARSVWPWARQVYGERRAGQAPLTSTDLLDEILDVGLAHITRVGGVDETWWRKLLDRMEHPFAAPDFIQIPAVQDWLCDAQVGADIKAIAKARILGNQVEDPTILERLAESYSAKTHCR